MRQLSENSITDQKQSQEGTEDDQEPLPPVKDAILEPIRVDLPLVSWSAFVADIRRAAKQTLIGTVTADRAVQIEFGRTCVTS